MCGKRKGTCIFYTVSHTVPIHHHIHSIILTTFTHPSIVNSGLGVDLSPVGGCSSMPLSSSSVLLLPGNGLLLLLNRLTEYLTDVVEFSLERAPCPSSHLILSSCQLLRKNLNTLSLCEMCSGSFNSSVMYVTILGRRSSASCRVLLLKICLPGRNGKVLSWPFFSPASSGNCDSSWHWRSKNSL